MDKAHDTFKSPFRSRRETGQALVADAFRRPDASILNLAIPLFFIGQNRHGLWVARNADASSGGLFLLKSSAMRFAHRARFPFTPAISMRASRFELDVPNSGNRYADCLAMLKHKRLCLTGALRRSTAALFKLVMTPLWTIRCRLAARRIHQAAARLTARP